jgi:hypothetical protein
MAVDARGVYVGAGGVNGRGHELDQLRVRPLHRLPQPDLQEVIKSLWSQVYGLSADVVIPRLEGAPRDDVDTDAKELLEIL